MRSLHTSRRSVEMVVHVYRGIMSWVKDVHVMRASIELSMTVAALSMNILAPELWTGSSIKDGMPLMTLS